MNDLHTDEFHVIASRLVKHLNNVIVVSRVAHWNVRGANFYEAHLMFERIYNELGELLDTMIEQLRALGHDPTFQELSGPGIDIPGFDATTLTELTFDYLVSAQAVFTSAFEYSEEVDDARMYGFGDFLQGGLQTMLQVQYLLQSAMGR
jgi:starvation-inducible DNA-binding protein